jgi:AAA domain (dynein-related subfamily)
LVIDELNRADVDRSPFGELMTVLAGGGAETTLVQRDGRNVSIGPNSRCTHQIPATFRVIATMNTWDKTSLFRLSHAVQRRFAIVNIDVPNAESYATLLQNHATREGFDPPLEEAVIRRVRQLFSMEGILRYRQIGPAVALDMVKYMRRRGGSGSGFAEAMSMFLFPQLEGMDQEPALKVLDVLSVVLSGWTDAQSLETMRCRYRELFPHLTFGESSR